MDKILIIDGNSILNRAYFGIPDLTNAVGLHTNAVYGFLNIMFKVMEEEHPDAMAVSFDLHAPTFRHKRYPEYKGTRKPMPEELREQVPVMKQMLDAMGIRRMELEGYEADDLIGTLARRSEEAGMQVTILSGDRDLLQLATDRTMVRIPKTKKGATEVENYLAEDVKRTYQVDPKTFIELKGLMGDTSDNIPGLPGVGEKTAAKILLAFGSVENAYAHVDEVKPPRAAAALREHYDLALLSRELATIVTDVPLDFTPQDCMLPEEIFTPEAVALMRELDFKSMVAKYGDGGAKTSAEDVEKHFVRVENAAEAKRHLKEAGQAARAGICLTGTGRVLPASAEVPMRQTEDGQLTFGDPEVWQELPKESEKNDRLSDSCVILGLALAYDDTYVYYLDHKIFASDRDFLDEVHEFYRSCACVCTLDLKNQIGFLCEEPVPGQTCDEQEWRLLSGANVFDAGLAAYLINPLNDKYDFDDIAKNDLGFTDWPFASELLKKDSPEKMYGERPEDYLRYLCFSAKAAFLSEPVLRGKLESMGMGNLLTEVEIPLACSLHRMEREGVRVNGDDLAAYGAQLRGEIGELETEIFELAGEKFNINSPKQLGEILFEKLKLPGGKKKKTGYSTAADVLEKLAPDYPLVDKVLKYRTLSKLNSTYAEGLAVFISEDGRIHGKFNQTITATGRISSTDPNLQNIPVRMEIGREIRKVFLPKEGSLFVDADYSQIELRILAHMAGDENLCQAYHEEQDIHRITASKVFGVPLQEVTAEQRRNAKAVNFGLVYGISSFGLSQDLSISRKEAAEYIEQYFVTYPGVRRFLDEAVADAKKLGYSVTLFGRRRPIPELKSSNYMTRSFGERVAMNAPIQGTAADIMKIAMVRVEKRLLQEGLKSRIVLQVHDELLVETDAAETERVKAILSEEMQGAADLKVPLAVGMEQGKNWFEAH
ncbi:MAG: DNA polymerase I [Lachnospiraceae bacterium]|nr:DNA polymerase I [Lachnospiraceae bacterium]